MAVGARFGVLFLLVFCIFVLSRVSEIRGQSVRSLYASRRKENTNIYVFERSENLNSVADSSGVWQSDGLKSHNLYKRSAGAEKNITTNVRFHFIVFHAVVCVNMQ